MEVIQIPADGRPGIVIEIADGPRLVRPIFAAPDGLPVFTIPNSNEQEVMVKMSPGWGPNSIIEVTAMPPRLNMLHRLIQLRMLLQGATPILV